MYDVCYAQDPDSGMFAPRVVKTKVVLTLLNVTIFCLDSLGSHAISTCIISPKSTSQDERDP